MRRILAVAGLAVTTLAANLAQAQDGAFTTATYVELVPPAANQGVALLRAYRGAGRKAAGAIRLDVAQRLDRPSQFVVLAVWKDKSAFDMHAASAEAKLLVDKLAPLFASPNDERQHNVLTVAAVKPTAPRAVIVVTHVDVPPPHKDAVIVLLRQLAAASRNESSNLRFDVWQQTARPNHFTVVETWTGQKAYDSHVMAAHTREFRGKLTPITGALYDERLYRPVP